MAKEDCPIKLGSTWIAAADLSSHQFRVMRQTAALTCTFTNTAGSGGIGILYNAPDTIGKACAIVVGNVCPVEAGAAFSQNDDLTNDSVGRLVTATPGDEVVASAVEAAGAAGEIVGAYIFPTALASSAGVTYRVPSNIETAAFAPAVVATWEDLDIIALLNTALTTDIDTAESVNLRGVLEIVNAAAVPYTAAMADGDTPDGDDVVTEYAVSAAIGSDFFDADFITDGSGQIRIEASNANVTFIYHLKSFSYVQNTAVS